MASSVYNALENLARLLQNQAGFWSLLIRRIAKMRGAENLYKRVSEGLNKEEIQDHLAVVLYALVFAANDFEVEIEPLAGSGSFESRPKSFCGGNPLSKNVPWTNPTRRR